MQESLRVSHHLKLAYCPCSNGTVEVVCRELLRATRELLSEFQMDQKCLPSVLPLVQSTLNSAPLKRLVNSCSLTAFTGLQQGTPLHYIKRKDGSTVTIQKIKEVRSKQRLETKSMLRSLQNMHNEILKKPSEERNKAIEEHNRKTRVQPAYFTTGEYVLRGILQRETGRKPSLR